MATKKPAAPTTAQAIESITAEAFAIANSAEPDTPQGTATTTEDSQDEPEPGRSTYIVQWHIKAEGRRHAPGETIALTDDQAAPMLAAGSITKADQ